MLDGRNLESSVSHTPTEKPPCKSTDSSSRTCSYWTFRSRRYHLKIRATYWILGVRAIVKNLIDKCTLCKAKLQKLLEQIMAPLPIKRLKPCPPFTNVMIDYFGPYIIRGTRQKRIRGKCFGVLFTCMIIRAVYVDNANDNLP